MTTEYKQVLLRGDTTAGWAAANPVLREREIAIDTTLRRIKVGDGSTGWNALAWATPDSITITQLQDLLATLGSVTAPVDAAMTAVQANPVSAFAQAQAKLFVSLKAAAKNPDLLIVGAVTVDSSDLVTSAAVVWPDGTPGTLTITARHSTGAVNAYNITYGSPVTKTYTQPTITRNTNGAATNIPQIVVS
jgi:hypothetical protein